MPIPVSRPLLKVIAKVPHWLIDKELRLPFGNTSFSAFEVPSESREGNSTKREIATSGQEAARQPSGSEPDLGARLGVLNASQKRQRV